MALFFIVALALSIVGMVSMLLIKRWELKSGRMLLAPARPRMSRAVEQGTFVAGTVAPLVARHWWEYGLEWAKLGVHRAAAWAVLYTEVTLEKVLTMLRYSTNPEAHGEASEFLREVAEHKKQIQSSAPTREAVGEPTTTSVLPE